MITKVENKLMSDVVETWSLIKWLGGGMASIIAVMGAVIWRRQNKDIYELRQKVDVMSEQFATKKQVEEIENDLKVGLHDVQAALRSHNKEVTQRLDSLLTHLLTNQRGDH